MVKLMAKLRSKKGQTLVEYGLILALIAVVVLVSLTALGTNVKSIFGTVSNSISGVSGAGG